MIIELVNITYFFMLFSFNLFSHSLSFNVVVFPTASESKMSNLFEFLRFPNQLFPRLRLIIIINREAVNQWGKNLKI